MHSSSGSHTVFNSRARFGHKTTSEPFKALLGPLPEPSQIPPGPLPDPLPDAARTRLGRLPATSVCLGLTPYTSDLRIDSDLFDSFPDTASHQTTMWYVILMSPLLASHPCSWHTYVFMQYNNRCIMCPMHLPTMMIFCSRSDEHNDNKSNDNNHIFSYCEASERIILFEVCSNSSSHHYTMCD